MSPTVALPRGAAREEREISGIKTVVYTIGSGDPLVFLHGAGTLSGFDWLAPLGERFRLIMPVHPGFGESEDDPDVDSVHDYVLHYLDLFDVLGLDRLVLVGHSFGGFIAARLAVEHARRLERLVLVAPAGLDVPAAPARDLFRVRPEDLPGTLTRDPHLLARASAGEGDLDRIVAGYREQSTLARVLWERNWDPKLARWLHRVTTPTLVVWGEDDQVIPSAQATVWGELIPGARVRTLSGRGHLVLAESEEALAVIEGFLGDAGRVGDEGNGSTGEDGPRRGPLTRG